jgi:TonB family protein
MRPLVLIFCLAISALLPCGPGLRAQNSAAPAPLTDPKEMMLAAARVNNLMGSDMKPWHIKATYQIVDDFGTVTDEGTYEEIWASATKYKQTFTGKTFSQTLYGTEKGLMRSKSDAMLSPLLADMRRELVQPLPSEQAVEHTDFVVKPLDANGLKLSCLQVAPAGSTGINNCVTTSSVIVRISAYAAAHRQALHNRILSYQNHYIAGDLKLMRGEKPVLTAHVDSIEPLPAVIDADFAPSADAVLMPKMVNISASVAQGMLAYKVTPEYPLAARNARVTGTVVVQAVIGKDGNLKNLKVVSGPDMLQAASLDAVRLWRYRPYLLNGEPVEVMTTINVIFTLGG